MLRKYFALIIVSVLLFGCTAERNEIIADLDNSEPAPVSSSEIAVPISESYGTVEVIGGDEQTLREFIQRWFIPMYASPSSPSTDNSTTITIGAFPEDLPAEFPLPEQAVVFASIQSPYDLQIMLDVPTNSEDMMAAYTQDLEKASWNQVPENVQSGGFVSATENWQIFCDEPSQAALVLQYYPKSTQETEMRVTLYTKDIQYMCDPQGMRGQDPASLMLPVLETPAGALVTGGGSSSGAGTAESSSDIKTDLSPSELNAHFSSQLEAAKWDRLDSSDENIFSWSSWKVTDEQGSQWNGTLIILKDPVDEDRLFAMMRVVKGSK
jgi:hypothetical protein